ncbi:ribosome biogenesis GTPase Der [Gammaproteobacteria bacterium]|nr:ribosome biogenesis GTPase Der [Gammaproteobacteria bacterium]
MNPQPVISIVGRANVGKSTLYNRLTGSRDAIVDDLPGVTRDRMVGKGVLGDTAYWIVDTGGYEHQDASVMQVLMHQQFLLAVEDSDAIILVVDGRAGLSIADEELANVLRSLTVPLYVAVNKSEGVEPDVASAEFHRLGIGAEMFAVSAKKGNGIKNMMDVILKTAAQGWVKESDEEADRPKVAILGKPNVGKSTLVNRLLGENRMIVSDIAGTTRDSVATPYSREGREYYLIDTAGVRRKSRVSEKIEKISIVKTLQTLQRAHVIILVIDAKIGITEQDASLAGLVREHGRSMVLAVNKWDGLDSHQKDKIRRGLQRELPFLDSVTVLFISAKHGSGVGRIIPAVDRAYDSAMADLGTAKLNVLLRRAVEAQPPPRVGRNQIKLKYAHQGGKNPPTVVIHGNLLNKVPESYKRYLANSISKGFKLTGTRVNLWFKTSNNPYLRGSSRAH